MWDFSLVWRFPHWIIGFVSPGSVVGKESYSEFLRSSGMSLQNTQPGMEAVQVLQGVCSTSARSKGKQIFLLLMLHYVLFHKFVNLCKSVHSVPEKTKPLSKQEVLTFVCTVFLGCQTVLLGSKTLRVLASVFFGGLLLKYFQWGSFFQLDIFLPQTFQAIVIFFLQNTGYPETRYAS